MNLTITVNNEDEARRALALLETYIRCEEMHCAPAPEQPAGTRIHDLELTVRANNALLSNDITTIEELTRWTWRELYRLPNLGRVSLEEIVGALAKRGLTLGMSARPAPTTHP